MANLKEQEKWEDGIYQIEENDPVLGGEDGITNKPIRQLANRTSWLKKALEVLTGKSKPKDLTEDSTSEADKNGHSHALPKSSTSQKGIVQLDDTWESDSREKAPTARVIKAIKALIDSVTRNLSNYIPNSKKSSSITSNSADTVATSAAVKMAYDKGVEALNKANEVDKSTLKKTGNQTLNGYLKTTYSSSRGWAGYQFDAAHGVWQLEANPAADTAGNRRFNMKWMPNSGTQVYLSFPHIGDNGDTVAYQSWVNAELQKMRSISNQNTANFGNYIHNNKKSNAVDSSSTDTVASSRAVKLAYDHGTTGLNTINDFKNGNGYVRNLTTNNNIQLRWNPSGKGLELKIDNTELGGVHYYNRPYVETTVSDSNYGGINIHRKGKAGNWDSRIEPLPDKRWKFLVQGSHETYLPAKGGTVALLEDFTQNLSGNGWCKLPNGLIMQWGKANGGWVNFPIAFPNSCFCVVGTQGEGRNYEPYIIINISNTKFYHKGKFEDDARNSHWIAIGR
ncbi:hypothetical protein BKK56_10520 [Rodentibacter genomosp. 2]|uniref:gp53-like domain-containing protein n=1 Tax=Rodentibacter genomosp. 2 TaxID=1908266 RepID=UPI00098439C9|nr:hypothetical protein BKK56_10520 [Rodentibacter genomosp. 2]